MYVYNELRSRHISCLRVFRVTVARRLRRCTNFVLHRFVTVVVSIVKIKLHVLIYSKSSHQHVFKVPDVDAYTEFKL